VSTEESGAHHRIAFSATGTSGRESIGGQAAGSMLFHSTMSIDLSSSWSPSEHGNPLPAFRQLTVLVEQDLKPDSTHHGPWAMGTLVEELSQVPAGRDALWASILGLWRLKYLEHIVEEEPEDVKQCWRSHVSAWVVRAHRRLQRTHYTYTTDLQTRHLDLCVSLKVKPSQVVREFGEELLARGYMEPGGVPPWDVNDYSLPSVPGTRPADLEPAAEDESGMNKYHVPFSVGGDAAIRQTPVDINKAESTRSDAGEKRNLAARSPDKTAEPSKQTRLENRTDSLSRLPSYDLDLSVRVYDDGSPVNPEDVSLAQGKVGERAITVASCAKPEVDMQAMREPRVNRGRLLSYVAKERA
jgi:hypothetical protein